LTDRTAVDPDIVARFRLAAQLGDRPVNGHPPALDQLVGLSSGTMSRLANELIDPHCHHLNTSRAIAAIASDSRTMTRAPFACRFVIHALPRIDAPDAGRSSLP